ncbi:MAG: GtrA family protein [Clostridiales bacterium]|jgi:putative flippase GtrA|nr:GtrA family protein [Eubacteriales bacterium]MDH7566574.1 GtrA family protein [Clostridiales bacterium]
MEDYIKKISIFSSGNVLGQFVRSVVVGGIASFVDIGIYSLGVIALGIHHRISNILSFISGLIVNYRLSREWVFNQKVHHVKKDFLLFSAIGVIGLLISDILLFILVDRRVLYFILPFSDSGLVKSAAKIITVVLVFFWNFFARKKMIFSS